jgi:hypothetical protein
LTFVGAGGMSEKYQYQTLATGVDTDRILKAVSLHRQGLRDSADYLDHPHHSLILVIYGVAVIDETPDNYGIGKGNYQLH